MKRSKKNKTQAYTWLVLGLFVGIFLTAVYYSGSLKYKNQDSPSETSQSAKNIDKHFIEQMISHHQLAITLAKLALEKGEYKEIKQLAENIEQTQTEEINKMEDWYKEWFGEEISTTSATVNHGRGMGIQMGFLGDEEDIRELTNAKPFDKKFIELMVPHEQMAILMSQILLRVSDREDLQNFAQDIITSQSREINQMRAWYQYWY